jgi:hypothetical protein
MVASATLLFLDGEWGFTSWSPPIPTALSSAKHRRGSPQSESKSGGRGWHWKAVCFEEKLKAHRGGESKGQLRIRSKLLQKLFCFRPPTPSVRPPIFMRASMAGSLACHLPATDTAVPAKSFYSGIRGHKPRPPPSNQRRHRSSRPFLCGHPWLEASPTIFRPTTPASRVSCADFQVSTVVKYN